MASSYPTGYDALTNPLPTDSQATVSHSSQHGNANDAIEAIEAELGLNPSGASATVAARLDLLATLASPTFTGTVTLPSGTVTSAMIADGTIATGDIADSAITSAKIANGTIATADIADSAVTSAKIADGTIVTADLADAAVTDAKIATGAAGGTQSVLRRLPAQVPAGELLLREAVWWIDAAHSSASGQTVTNLGWGGSALDATVGSSGSADSNDPKFLDWDGTNYLYLPGVAGNGLSVPDAANLDIVGDIDIRVRVALDDWTPSSANFLLGKWVSSGSQLSYLLRVTTTGALQFNWTTLGTAASSIGAVSTATVSVADGDPKWVRVTLDVDNGAGTPQYEVKFYTSDNGSTWTQLGSTITGTTGVTSIFSGSAALSVGSADADGLTMTGKLYRAQVLNGIAGTTVLDIDTSLVSSGSATSFDARTGQTVTINRASSGRKTVAVVNPCFLLGTDDYPEVPDSDLIDFGASDSFSVIAVYRDFGTTTAVGSIVSKKAALTAGSGGYSLYRYAPGTDGVTFEIGDGTANPYDSANTAASSGGLLVSTGVRNVTADTLQALVNGAGNAATTDTSTGTLATSEVLRVGRLSGAGTSYAHMEFYAAAVFRRALTGTEVTTLSNYFTGRIV